MNHAEYMRKWRAKDPEKDREYMRQWKLANPEKVREYRRRWAKTDAYRAYQSAYKKKLRQASARSQLSAPVARV